MKSRGYSMCLLSLTAYLRKLDFAPWFNLPVTSTKQYAKGDRRCHLSCTWSHLPITSLNTHRSRFELPVAPAYAAFPSISQPSCIVPAQTSWILPRFRAFQSGLVSFISNWRVAPLVITKQNIYARIKLLHTLCWSQQSSTLVPTRELLIIELFFLSFAVKDPKMSGKRTETWS